MLAEAQLDSFKRKAVGLYTRHRRIRYGFTSFDGNYSDVTYHMVSHIFAAHGMGFLENVVMTLLRECISNAVKANLKRAYFQSQNADISNAEDYEKIIQNFKMEGVSRLKDFIPKMEKMGLKVQLFMEDNGDHMRFIVENNAGMTADEVKRVRERIDAAADLKSIADAFENFTDDQEGAGLGLLINVMLLKKSGIGPENFKIASDQSKTRVSLRVPSSLNMPADIKEIYQQITAELQQIPTFPEAVHRILGLCDDPDSDASHIAREIERDPSLATSIVKLANSGGFVVGQQISSISRAVTIIGIKNVRQLTMAQSSRQILDQQYPIYASFWEHAEKCAIYSRLIAEKYELKKISDSVYLGGLLHDLGKIVLQAVSPEVIQQINGIQLERNENSTAVLEEITLGLSHAEVGAQLAERWNFPTNLVQMIRYHHSSFASDKEFRLQVAIVHLADALLRVEDKRVNYVYFDVDAQSQLGINDAFELSDLHDYIKEKYEFIKVQ